MVAGVGIPVFCIPKKAQFIPPPTNGFKIFVLKIDATLSVAASFHFFSLTALSIFVCNQELNKLSGFDTILFGS